MVLRKLVYEYGSELDWDSNNKFIDETFTSPYFQDGEYFRSGRDALRAIAIKFKRQYKRVLLPALCCESMVTPFELNGYGISYFKLNNDISADFKDILLKLEPDTIFIYMNYFGIPSLTDTQLNIIKEQFQNVIMIEDRTHDVLMNRRCRFTPDYTVFSIRKWVAIPDGGILYSRFKDMTFPKEEDNYFSELRTEALIRKSEYLRLGEIDIKKIFRRKLEEANNYLDKTKTVAAMSLKSYEILKNIDFEKITKYRYENTQLFSQRLKSSFMTKKILLESAQGGLYFPILVKNRDMIQRALSEKNIYCPVLWPLPEAAKGICDVSDYISNNMLALPCDHRYKKAEIEHICNVLSQLLENE
jgi:hypothetical protein